MWFLSPPDVRLTQEDARSEERREIYLFPAFLSPRIRRKKSRHFLCLLFFVSHLSSKSSAESTNKQQWVSPPPPFFTCPSAFLSREVRIEDKGKQGKSYYSSFCPFAVEEEKPPAVHVYVFRSVGLCSVGWKNARTRPRLFFQQSLPPPFSLPLTLFSRSIFFEHKKAGAAMLTQLLGQEGRILFAQGVHYFRNKKRCT